MTKSQEAVLRAACRLYHAHHEGINRALSALSRAVRAMEKKGEQPREQP